MATGDHLERGRTGEALAAAHLRRLGHRVLETNHRAARGEIDIITLDPAGGTVCFVEVKTRSHERVASPEAAVNAEKRRRIKALAADYFAVHKLSTLKFRFDVIAVVLEPGKTPVIRHHEACWMGEPRGR